MLLPSAILLAAAMTYTTKTECKDVTYVPAPNVEYQEGVDAKGWMVAPADINPPALTKEDFRRMPVPLNVPLENYPAGKPDFAKSDSEWQREQQARKDAEDKKPGPSTYNPDMSQSWVQPGLVTVDTETGQAAFNGKPLSQLLTDCQ